MTIIDLMVGIDCFAWVTLTLEVRGDDSAIYLTEVTHISKKSENHSLYHTTLYATDRLREEDVDTVSEGHSLCEFGALSVKSY